MTKVNPNDFTKFRAFYNDKDDIQSQNKPPFVIVQKTFLMNSKISVIALLQ